MDILKSLLLNGTSSSLIKVVINAIINAVITFFFGFISFKIFERYKNKKDNNKLLIHFIKLEKELAKNEGKLNKILDEHARNKRLRNQFYIDGFFSDKLYKLYEDIYQIENTFYWEEPECEDGCQVGWERFYSRRADSTILDLRKAIADKEGSPDYDDYAELSLEDLKSRLAEYEEKDLYIDLLEIENETTSFIEQSFILHDSIEFLDSKLKKYNALSEQDKDKYLARFCRVIFKDENEFTKSYETFKTFRKFISPNNKNKLFKLDFNLWESVDLDSFAVYDAETYLALEDLYSRLHLLILPTHDIEEIEKTNNLLKNELRPIIDKEAKKLRKTLLKTNKQFKRM